MVMAGKYMRAKHAFPVITWLFDLLVDGQQTKSFCENIDLLFRPRRGQRIFRRKSVLQRKPCEIPHIPRNHLLVGPNFGVFPISEGATFMLVEFGNWHRIRSFGLPWSLAAPLTGR